jgi:hypothetical protein
MPFTHNEERRLSPNHEIEFSLPRLFGLQGTFLLFVLFSFVIGMSPPPEKVVER